MSDAAAFLRAILAAPADDAPRLIYADWLEERGGTVECPKCMPAAHYPFLCGRCAGSGRVPDGDADRAEFLRKQVKNKEKFDLNAFLRVATRVQ